MLPTIWFYKNQVATTVTDLYIVHPKFGKLSSGHRTGKGQFAFQSQRKAMPKNALTTAQLHSSLFQFQFSRSGMSNCDPINYSMPGLPFYHELLEFTQTHVHQVGDAIQPSHPLLSPSLLPPIPPSMSLFQ